LLIIAISIIIIYIKFFVYCLSLTFCRAAQVCR
jgi:hypothetical protein